MFVEPVGEKGDEEQDVKRFQPREEGRPTPSDMFANQNGVLVRWYMLATVQQVPVLPVCLESSLNGSGKRAIMKL